MEIELASLDLRYEGHRLRDRAGEARLLVSMTERGIAEPLEGVEQTAQHVLLNGFKRCRCARLLGLTSVPYQSMGADTAMGIVALLRASNDRALGILEQASFVDELQRLHAMSLAEIATALSRSKAWVCLRMSLLTELTPVVRQKLFAGLFPVYAYMYSVRPFMRINGVGKADIEQFVVALSGKQLSLREIDCLARSYFRGGEKLRDQIRQGHVALSLEQFANSAPATADCTLFEQAMLKDLEHVQKYQQRVSGNGPDLRLSSPAFRAQAHLLLGGLLSRTPSFLESVRSLHDRCRQT